MGGYRGVYSKIFLIITRVGNERDDQTCVRSYVDWIGEASRHVRKMRYFFDAVFHCMTSLRIHRVRLFPLRVEILAGTERWRCIVSVAVAKIRGQTEVT